MKNKTTGQNVSSALAIPCLVVLVAICRSALAGDTYTIHENLHVGDKRTYVCNCDYKEKVASSSNGATTVTDNESRNEWRVTLTDQEVKDGSAMRILANVDPGSTDTTRDDGAAEVKTPCPFAGNSIIIRRRADDSLTNFFQGKASDEDNNLLNDFASPDEAFYPDKPVAVGDSWDDSAKAGKFSQLGPKDQEMSQGRLDWVKMIDGKQMAHITQSIAIIYHLDGNVEEDQQFSVMQLVDMASGVVVQEDETGTIKYSTAKSEATQVTGGGEITYHAQVLPSGASAPATNP